MKRLLLFSALLLTAVGAVAQDHKTITLSKPATAPYVTVKLYGFIRNYFNFDSRETYTVIGDEYNMIPFDEHWNEDGSEDINAVPHASLQALTSRFGLAVAGPSLFGAGLSGKLEGDFGGFGQNNTVLRLRLAYVKMTWMGCRGRVSSVRSELLLGQDWHPLSGDIMPDVLGMAAGAPFRPHSRTPQFRATYYWGDFGMTAALLYQLQYVNNGPASPSNPSSVSSTDFALNALWPEAFIGLNYRSESLKMQLGVDAQLLRPRTHALVGGRTVKVDETVRSLTPTLYAQYDGGLWSVKFRTLLAQNTSHLNQLSGYAVTGVNADGSWNYEPLRASISYLNIAYGKKWRANLFLGYMKNLGVDGDVYNFGTAAVPQYYLYVKGGDNFTNLNSAYRVAPSLSYNIKAFNLGLEYEMTAATYGDIKNDASVEAKRHVVNHRICAMVKYNF